MKKMAKKIVGGLLIAALLAGCGGTTKPNGGDIDASVDVNNGQDGSGENAGNENNQNGNEENNGNAGTGEDGNNGNTGTGEDGNNGNTGTGEDGNNGSTGTGEDGNNGNTGTGEDGNNGNTGTGNGQNGTEGSTGSNPSGGIQIEIPGGKLANYTSVKDLNLEAGSHIAVVVKGEDVGYWDAVKKGMEQAISELNAALGYEGNDKIYMTYEKPKVENSVDEQVNILDSVVSENPDVICLAAIDMNSCMPQIEAAGQNGIPVIVLDSGISWEELVAANCSTDNFRAGKEAAKRLCESIGGEGEIAVLAHIELSETSQSRLEGFMAEIRENYPKVELVNISYDEVDAESSLEEKMRAVLTLYPKLKGYFCTNQVVSEVALKVLAEDTYKNLTLSVVGFDMGEKQMAAIRAGKQLGTVSQNPYGMGYATIVAGVRAALGLENDAFIDAGYQWLDQTNIDLEENAKYLYK